MGVFVGFSAFHYILYSTHKRLLVEMPGGARPPGVAPKKAAKRVAKKTVAAAPAAPASTAAVADPPVELDQDADEKRVQPSTELLLPAWPGAFLDRFNLVVSKRAFDGWVRQPSPCCAAASVAGAWCALSRFEPERHCPRAAAACREQLADVPRSLNMCSS